jgi:HlyD family secretion protein
MKKSHRIAVYAVSGALVVGSAILAYESVNISREPTLATVAVKRADLVHGIDITGTVKAETDVDLAFARGGTVSHVYADVGDKVYAGQVIATLDSEDLVAQLAQAQAGQAAAEAKLAELKAGARSEDVDVSDSSVRAAQASVTEAKSGVIDALQDSYAESDDAIRGMSDQFFTDPFGTSPRLSFFIPDQRFADDLGSNRSLMETRLQDWKSALATTTADSDLDAATAAAKENLDAVSAFLDDDAVALDKFVADANPSMPEITVDGYKADISAARANVNAVESALTASAAKLVAADAALDLADSQKTLKVAAPAPEDLDIQEAAVQQAAAAVEAASAQLDNASLRSPVDGTVSREDAKVGATATPGVPVVTVLGQGLFETDALVPEADIADVQGGMDAVVTLDAYGTGVPFDATVISVDPAESTVAGDTGYKATLRFRDADERIKSGMTANVRIISATHDDAIVVPRDAVITRDGDAFVLLVVDGRTQEQKVTIGLDGENGDVEILDGLKVGDQVASFGNSN